MKKKLHIDKAQFNKEFEIYSEIWSQLVDMRIVIEMLRPFLDNHDEGKTYEETIAARSRAAIEKGNLLISTVEQNKPFYARHVYANLTDLIGLMKNEIYEISTRDRDNRNYWDDRKAGLSKFTEFSDKICESIRQRIGQINAI